VQELEVLIETEQVHCQRFRFIEEVDIIGVLAKKFLQIDASLIDVAKG